MRSTTCSDHDVPGLVCTKRSACQWVQSHFLVWRVAPTQLSDVASYRASVMCMFAAIPMEKEANPTVCETISVAPAPKVMYLLPPVDRSYRRVVCKKILALRYSGPSPWCSKLTLEPRSTGSAKTRISDRCFTVVAACSRACHHIFCSRDVGQVRPDGWEMCLLA